MSLPYEGATAGKRALTVIESTLREFGCNKFGNWFDYDTGTLTIQFEWRGRAVELRASASGYAAAWLKEHPYTWKTNGTEQQHKQKAYAIAERAIYSMLRDWIKGQVTAVECGLLSFEEVFMPQMMLPNGRRLIDAAKEQFLLTDEKDSE